uniref:Uncharacterized protein n=1 Tax=virus sp. ct8MV80 TaxID=2826793 RepID=A0A8S5R7I2_9VIRU|nr:MAG TPA: hypothetical protein [virus sp. ct8MV80]DAV73408.1 MAG TPA: hypothetical protein [Bacteriophage sp.]DAW91631.1 MAG TPA: hypothetical protein [Bacteriophage sp.]
MTFMMKRVIFRKFFRMVFLKNGREMLLYW